MSLSVLVLVLVLVVVVAIVGLGAALLVHFCLALATPIRAAAGAVGVMVAVPRWPGSKVGVAVRRPKGA